jgi:hypothetical protein
MIRECVKLGCALQLSVWAHILADPEKQSRETA